ncbi:MAG: hypothetical protein OES57_01380 [Acidimicrobiia bacterium]|nr:hypothetical protein [Acidimicrobiia bacterium]
MTTVDRPGELLDTTELRWFGDGPLPRDVLDWFVHHSQRGTVEDRTDLYRLDGRADVGVKRRSGTTLERKVRLIVEEPLALGADMAGRTEVWRKWSPAVEPVVDDGASPWVSVRKQVVKRLFAVDGDEREFSLAMRAAMDAGCDVELAEVSVDGRRAWTLAFASFGPAAMRREAIVTCWRALETDGPAPDHLAARCSTLSGYPQWLQTAAGLPRRSSTI